MLAMMHLQNDPRHFEKVRRKQQEEKPKFAFFDQLGSRDINDILFPKIVVHGKVYNYTDLVNIDFSGEI